MSSNTASIDEVGVLGDVGVLQRGRDQQRHALLHLSALSGPS
jgi:hypothetical protein